jgi:hypothetical protein
VWPWARGTSAGAERRHRALARSSMSTNLPEKLGVHRRQPNQARAEPPPPPTTAQCSRTRPPHPRPCSHPQRKLRTRWRKPCLRGIESRPGAQPGGCGSGVILAQNQIGTSPGRSSRTWCSGLPLPVRRPPAPKRTTYSTVYPSAWAFSRTRLSRVMMVTSGGGSPTSSVVARWTASRVRTGSTGNGRRTRASTASVTATT